MAKTQSEITQIAVLNVMLQAVKDTQLSMAADIREIKNSKYVTQNDMQLAIKAVTDEWSASIKDLKEQIGQQTKVGMWVGGLIIAAFVAALAKLVFKA